MSCLKPAYATFDSPMGKLKAAFTTGLSGDRIACVTGAISVASSIRCFTTPPSPRPTPLKQKLQGPCQNSTKDLGFSIFLNLWNPNLEKVQLI